MSYTRAPTLARTASGGASPPDLLLFGREPDLAVSEAGTTLWHHYVGASVLASYEAALSSIEHVFHLRDPGRVKALLRAQPELLELLLDAQSHVSDAFEGFPRLLLEVLADPEEDMERLFLLVQTRYSPEEAMNRLDTLGAAWWLANMGRANGLLAVDVEFA